MHDWKAALRSAIAAKEDRRRQLAENQNQARAFGTDVVRRAFEALGDELHANGKEGAVSGVPNGAKLVVKDGMGKEEFRYEVRAVATAESVQLVVLCYVAVGDVPRPVPAMGDGKDINSLTHESIVDMFVSDFESSIPVALP